MSQIDFTNIESASEAILKMLPQQDPFRFADKITHLDEDSIEGTYRFKEDEYFYKGHFPGNPVTPGVILVETMAQIGVCSLSAYLLMKEGLDPDARITTLFTDNDTEFLKAVYPGEEVTVKAKKIFWRRKKLRCECELYLSNGELAARGTLSGMGVLNES